jgi:hypothetical protein
VSGRELAVVGRDVNGLEEGREAWKKRRLEDDLFSMSGAGEEY